eukprot:g12531.t1
MSVTPTDNTTQLVFERVIARPVAAPDLQHGRLIHLLWRAADQGERLVQFYLNGQLSGSSLSITQREAWLLVDPDQHTQIELLAVDPALVTTSFSSELVGLIPPADPAASLSVMRDLSLSAGTTLGVSVDGGLAERVPLFSPGDARGGFGAVFGEGGFGYDTSTGPGLGQGQLGYGPLGSDGDALCWRDDSLATGTHTITLSLEDQAGHARANDLRVYPMGGRMVGVRAGRCFVGDEPREITAPSPIELAADATTHLYVDEAGSIATSTTGLPADRATFIPLAEVTTDSDSITQQTDLRGEAILQAQTAALAGITASADEINQALEGIDPNVTAANLSLLTGGALSTADAQHRHLSTGQDVDGPATVAFTNLSTDSSATIGLELSMPLVMPDVTRLEVDRANGFLAQSYLGTSFHLLGSTALHWTYTGAFNTTQSGQLVGAIPVDGEVVAVVLSTRVNTQSSDTADGLTLDAYVNGNALTATPGELMANAGSGFRSTDQGDGTAAALVTDGTEDVSRGDLITIDVTYTANGTVSQEPTDLGIAAMVGSAHPTAGVSYPEAGLQPYYEWLINALHRLAESSAGDLRVWQDADSAASIWVAPGRCSIAGQALAYDGGSIDLGLYNNSTALVWVQDNAGAAEIAVADIGAGWPVVDHLRLAEVELETGEVDFEVPGLGEFASPVVEVSSYTQAVAALSPLAYWRLNEQSGTTLADELSAYPLTLSGDYTLGQEGALATHPDDAVAFASGTATAPGPVIPGSSSAAFSFMFWIRTTGAFSNWRVFLQQYESSTTGHLRIILRFNGQLRLSTIGEVKFDTVGSISTDWRMVTLTRTSSGTITWYIDGQQDAQATAHTTAVHSSNFTLGSIGSNLPEVVLDEIDTAGQPGALLHDLGADQNTLYVRLMVNATQASNGALTIAGGLRADRRSVWQIVLDTDTPAIRFEAGDATISAALSNVIAWHCVEVSLDATTGDSALRLNGIERATLNTALDPTRQAWVGGAFFSAGLTGTVQLDRWVIAQEPIGVPVATPEQDHGGDPRRWLVVYNREDADSRTFAEAYRARRGVPYANLCGLDLPTTEAISAAQFETMRQQINDYLDENDLRQHIVGVLLGHNVPGYADVAGQGSLTPIASYLHTDDTHGLPVVNPLYQSTISGRPAASEYVGVRLTGRVDAPNLSEAIALLDRADDLLTNPLAHDNAADVLIDINPDNPNVGPVYTQPVADWVGGQGLSSLRLPAMVYDTQPPVKASHEAVVWGWRDAAPPPGYFASPAGRRAVCMQFDPEPDAAVTVRDPGAADWLSAALRAGYAFAAAPSRAYSLSSLPLPHLFFGGLRQGWTVAEAWLVAQPFVRDGLQLIGDPLMPIAFPKSGFDVFGPAARLDLIDLGTPLATLHAGERELALGAGDLPGTGESLRYLVRRLDNEGRPDHASAAAYAAVDAGRPVRPALAAWPSREGWQVLQRDGQLLLTAHWPVSLRHLGIDLVRLTAQAGSEEPVALDEVKPANGQRCVSFVAAPPSMPTRYRFTTTQGQAVFESPWSQLDRREAALRFSEGLAIPGGIAEDAEVTVAVPHGLSDGEVRWQVLLSGQLVQEDRTSRVGTDTRDRLVRDRLAGLMLEPIATLGPWQSDGLALEDVIQRLSAVLDAELVLACDTGLLVTPLTSSSPQQDTIAARLQPVLSSLGLSLKQALELDEERVRRTLTLFPERSGRRVSLPWPDEQGRGGSVVSVVVNRESKPPRAWVARGDRPVVEDTFTLQQGWEPGLEGQPDSDYGRLTSSDFSRYGSVYRDWVLNEDGAYNDSPFNLGQTFDAGALFDQPSTIEEPLRLGSCLTRSAAGRRLAPVIESSTDSGSTWSAYPGQAEVMNDRAGVVLTDDDLPVAILSAAKAGTLQLRVTATLTSPDAIEVKRWDGNPFAGPAPTRVIEFSDPFAWRHVATTSIHHPSIDSGLLQADTADDRAALRAQLQAHIAAQPGPDAAARLDLVGAWTALRAGDRVREALGRGLAIDGHPAHFGTRDARIQRIDFTFGFGVAGLMGALWLWERLYSRKRESELTQAHQKLTAQQQELHILIDLVNRNTAAIERFEQTQQRGEAVDPQTRRVDEQAVRQDKEWPKWFPSAADVRVHPASRYVKERDELRLEARIELLDEFNEPIKDVGTLVVELRLLDRQGKLILDENGRQRGFRWSFDLTRKEQQQLLWDPIARAYVLPLKIGDSDTDLPQFRTVLVTTFQPAWPNKPMLPEGERQPVEIRTDW